MKHATRIVATLMLLSLVATGLFAAGGEESSASEERR